MSIIERFIFSDSEFAGLGDLPELSQLKLDIMMENRGINKSASFVSPPKMSGKINTDKAAKCSREMPTQVCG